MSTPHQDTAVRVFAPATVANVTCGFDIFGFAVAAIGDVVLARRGARPGVVLTDVRGEGGRLPREASSNTAGVAAQAVLDHLASHSTGRQSPPGVELELDKGIPLASGMGSSAASAVAAAVAVDAVLGAGLPRSVLVRCAMEGEKLAAGFAHADNAAPSLLGGFVLVRGGASEPRVTSLRVPAELWCALLHPHLEIETSTARDVLPSDIPLRDAVQQWGNTAALVAALYESDWDLLASALHDLVAEPVRSRRVPAFDDVMAAAREAGAIGGGLSGSGPSLYAFCRGEASAGAVGEAMRGRFTRATGVEADLYLSSVDAPGARRLDPR